MTFVQDFAKSLIELITSPNGSLAYHLVTLFAIYLILGIAVGHWNRHRRDPTATRLLIAGIGLALARILLMLVAVLDLVGLASANVILPPLERSLDLATLLLAVWAFLPIVERHARLSGAFLLLALLILSGVYAAFASLWPQAEAQSIAYNGYWQETAWELADMAILALALFASLIWRKGDWSLAACLFAVWLTGHILQFTFPTFPFEKSHTAGWVRAVNLIALPLLASLTYRRALGVFSTASGDTALELIGIFRAARRIETAHDVEAALGLAAASIARALGTDMVAVGFPTTEPPKGIRIVALHPPTGALLAQKELKLRTSAYPLLATALQTARLQSARTLRKDPSIATLYSNLGFERPGPLLVQPLTDGETMLGLMLIGNPISQQPWTSRDEQIVQAINAAITTSLISARRRATYDRSAELQKALTETNRLAQRATELEEELDRQRQHAGELATKLRLKEHETATQSQAVTEAAIWQAEIHELAEARTALETELTEWKRKAEQLAHSKDDLQIQLAQVQTDLKQARSQDKASDEWKEKAEQLASSRDDLQNQLAQVQTKIQEAQNQAAALVEWREKAEQLASSRDDLQNQLAQVKAKLEETQSQTIALASTEHLTSGKLGGTLLCDEHGNIIMVSQGAQQLTGKSRSILAGTPLQTLFDEPLWSQAVSNLLRKDAQSGEASAVTLDLNERMVRAELTRLPGAAGVPGVLAAMLYPEEGKGTIQTEMVGSLINELRTPMTSITGYTDLLLGETVGILGEMQRQFLLRVQANIERMGRLLNDLIRVTTIDAGHILLSPEPVDIISVVEDAIMSLSVEFSERKLTVQLDMPPTLPPVHADRDSLYQIVLNLLSNASQCSESGTEILVRAQLEEHDDQIAGLPDYLLVSTTDTGGGISPEDQSRVFQRLYRANNPLIEGLGETGVGLSIAKALVEANGGRIWVESEMEVGSTFSFILPLSSKDNDSPTEN
ncbi:MAG: hypothetical protein DRI77_02520 [Chloroflexi bacterium]|nr:MAG: hypothetical protein DRI77_02520 [Chloroflexota bacterium]